MLSVILDEFAPFAYPGFTQVLQTARGARVSFLFSFQSLPQLQRGEPGILRRGLFRAQAQR